MKSNLAQICVAALLGLSSAMLAQQQTPPPPGAIMPNVLYGAAYYNEYIPAALQPGRLEKDVALMKEAAISVVRLGEPTWSLLKRAAGQVEHASRHRTADS